MLVTFAWRLSLFWYWLSPYRPIIYQSIRFPDRAGRHLRLIANLHHIFIVLDITFGSPYIFTRNLGLLRSNVIRSPRTLSTASASRALYLQNQDVCVHASRGYVLLFPYEPHRLFNVHIQTL